MGESVEYLEHITEGVSANLQQLERKQVTIRRQHNLQRPLRIYVAHFHEDKRHVAPKVLNG